jgi:hypothetical protein
MAEQGEVVFRQRVCRGCNAVFCICRSCDRGQRYCSPSCRLPAIRDQRRRANRRHQHSPEGRLDHRDRQREYRKRCAQRRVTDTSSVALISPGNIFAWHPGSRRRVIHAGFTAASRDCRLQANGRRCCGEFQTGQFSPLRCVICGRPGRFLDPFPPSPRL